MPRKLILSNPQAPGDIVMLTAAVRDLHRAYPGEFLTDVRTFFPDLWRHNPYITPIADDDPEAERISCHYPLIHRCNDVPCHFLHGFPAYLNEQLGLTIRVTEFKGDIHLSDEEKREAEDLRASDPDRRPYWLFVSGGKYDFTIKWWDPARMQQVVNHFLGRIDFVQVGDGSHHHPALEHVVDLRGQTTLRQLIRLVHHAQGIISPVSLLMHLAAAVETPAWRLRHRPCVVIAGGREPPHWTAYPHHQYLHSVGALACCDNGGCWRSRTLPVGDGDEKDHPDQLCVDVVGTLPRCMDLITAADVIARVELYFTGGALSNEQRREPPQKR